ncbi:MAG: hypothetical protein US54_C0057G0003 [Candidatus Roizmanbacteria bacterium GW2011_GWA2_37_7]|uniref:Outer membrane lipoprotein carrier protein LolA n=1 Tax=Candidatus Roizmanbacteria bacterium GW2011_GWA2_37_7 TaxID=1618481 RepID=A0A0G0JJ21_9BACT|nr:MAG: hypothetical protein US54_C0057G0003 [Candidatus Roizmanbacteria bacterium GW2011_GWA2_37_7]
MSFHAKKTIIIGILLVLFISGFFVYKTFLESRCQEDDIRICKLLSQLEIDHLTHLSGTYTELNNDVPIYKVEWAIDTTVQEIRQKDETKETMHLIYTNDSIYLKDYSDDQWWEQPASVIEKYDIKLPFDPTVFFTNLARDIQNPQNSLSYTHQDICGIKTCNVFSLKKENNQTVLFYLDETQEQIQQIMISEGEAVQKVVFQYEDFQIDVPSSQVKTASSGQNIFFENFLQQSSMQKEKPAYVQEFEQTRMQIEEGGE